MKLIGGPKDGRWTARYVLWRLVRFFVFGYLVLFVFACTVGNRMIFHPPPSSYDGSEARHVSFEGVSGFYEAATNPEMPTLIWSHGNAEDAGQVVMLGDLFTRLGYGFLVYDYPGYGLSEGTPDEQSCYRSAEKAYHFLRDEKAIPPDQIIAVGQSVGSGMATWLAAEKEVGGLILIAPFKSAFRVATRVRILPWDPFNNLAKMAQVTAPVLVIHGDEDEVIAYLQGKKVFAAATSAKRMETVEGGRHNDLWVNHRQQMLSAMRRFLDEYQSER
ncbi:MAG: alpha/beta fold hydrolase [Verrucomicrobiota bacterium JB023]|nr:alpha/beta fold hydrolase [Verrucomicrobiota bacterium JB023]